VQIARHHLIQIVPDLLATLAGVPAARAQDPSMNAAAGQIANAITPAQQRRVIVFDFSGANRKITPLGQKMPTSSVPRSPSLPRSFLSKIARKSPAQ